jgi:hypothetical protein
MGLTVTIGVAVCNNNLYKLAPGSTVPTLLQASYGFFVDIAGVEAAC